MSRVSGAEGGRTHFDSEIAAVNVVPEKEIACLRERAADVEYLHQVVLLVAESAVNAACYVGSAYILSVDITTHCGCRSVHRSATASRYKIGGAEIGNGTVHPDSRTKYEIEQSTPCMEASLDASKAAPAGATRYEYRVCGFLLHSIYVEQCYPTRLPR